MNKEELDRGFPGHSNFFSKACVGQTHLKFQIKKNKNTFSATFAAFTVTLKH
jgi:hypothetical protein